MTKEIPMTKFQNELAWLADHCFLGLGHSLVIMVSPYVISLK